MYIPDSNSREMLGWCKEALQEGEGFLKAQRGYTKIQDCIDAIMGDKSDIRSTSLSSTTSNHIAKIAEDSAAYLTDIRPFWEYKTWNKKYEQNAEIFSKLSLHWWHSGGTAKMGADMNFMNVVKYALTGTGYAHLTYNDRWGDVCLEDEDPRDVIPIRPGSNLTIQDAFGVIVRRERTVNYVRSLKIFKGKEYQIEATRDGAFAASLNETRAGKLMEWLGSPFRNRLFENKSARDIPRIPTLDLYTMYLTDDSINKSKDIRYMGDWHLIPREGCIECIGETPHPLTNWSYKVKPGEPLYPNKRKVVFTDTVVGYDGPSPYWHGLFPLAKLTLVPYPWTYLGKGLLWDCLPLQRSLDKSLRIVDDNLEKVARPDIVADKNSISKAMLDRIDTRKAGGKFLTNPLAGKGFAIQPPPNLPPQVREFIEFYINEMNVLSGVSDLSQLSKLGQLPEAETVEKIMGTMSASIRLRSRVIENFMREFAQMLAYNFTQFYTLPQRLAILGERGMTPEDFDFDPGNLIPDYVHDSDMDPITGVPTREAVERGPRPKQDRAKAFLQQFAYNVAPNSLLNSSEIERKLLYLQLSRAGLVDHWTLLEQLDIPNVGQPPAGADTITERLLAEQNMGIGMSVSPAGRKATGQKMPRTVVKES